MKKRHPHKTNILLVNITRLGDMLQATPTIFGMKQENPECKVTVLVEKQFEDICKIIPGIDEVVSIDLGMTVRSLAREQEGMIDAFEYVDEFVEDLRRRNFDYSLNMSSSAYTALLLRTLGIEKSGGWTADEEGYRIIESDWARLFASSVFHQNRQYNGLNLVDVFRCSADIEKHPQKLMLNIPEAARTDAHALIAEAHFSNEGPLIAIQAGASQAKRQWSPSYFIRLVNTLTEKYKARILLTGSKKELSIIEPIRAGAEDVRNVHIVAGKTNIPQLGALLAECNVLVTGDTGPMHMSVAVGTPVVAMFLASAFGFETGPYSEGNIVIQPIIGCGPCNPNKSCGRPDCHDTISPEWLAELTMMRVKEDIRVLPQGFVDSNKMVVYRSCFDQWGFCDLQPMHNPFYDRLLRYRKAYRKLWLDDLGGYPQELESAAKSSLAMHSEGLEGLKEIVNLADQGMQHIARLEKAIRDVYSPPAMLGEINERIVGFDRQIEEIGFHYAPLGPITRMFVFGKENLSGSDALSLASQMGGTYEALKRRCQKLERYYNAC